MSNKVYIRYHQENGKLGMKQELETILQNGQLTLNQRDSLNHVKDFIERARQGCYE